MKSCEKNLKNILFSKCIFVYSQVNKHENSSGIGSNSGPQQHKWEYQQFIIYMLF